MDIHEYQAKEILSSFGVTIPRGGIVYSPENAEDITHKIHDEGSAVVAIYPYEIAEQKGVEVTVLARSRGFPLQVKIEKE